jgi:hypothetical protein
MKTLNYNGIEISFYQNQTIGNCIDLGFGFEKIKSIILEMKSKGLDYLNKKELNKYR